MEFQHLELDRTHLFHLRAGEMSYALMAQPDGSLVHLHFGGEVRNIRSFVPLAQETLPGSADAPAVLPFELPCGEPFDFTTPQLAVTHPDGVTSLRLVYAGYEAVEDLVRIFLRDAVYPVEVTLLYRGYGALPLISRSMLVKNAGPAPLLLRSALSAAWQLPSGTDYRLTHYAGDWGAEYEKQQTVLTQSKLELDCTRLTAGSSQQTPFFMLDNGTATETAGEVWFGALHWTGDFSLVFHRQYGGLLTVAGGINPATASLTLQPGETFETPLFTGGFVSGGFEKVSNTLYDWQLDHIIPRGRQTDKAHAVRPVIYNSWYPFYFAVTEQNCLDMIDRCGDIGAELFVIDDGWMPGRTGDKAGLGDWVADPARFPRGLSVISRHAHEKGLLFGLWVEPEMVNPDSDLYRAHPDWVLHDPARPRTEWRNQLILNLAREDVRDWVIETLDRVIEEYELDYLKWDMNRYASECGWPAGTEAQRQSLRSTYIRHLTEIWQRLNAKYPDLLLENCASGGGRSNFGMVPLADRVNRSDNSDPVDVLALHEGYTTMFLPKTAGGAGNIASPVTGMNGRAVPLEFRCILGMTGSMSIGVNLLTADRKTTDALRRTVLEFKRLRPILQDAYVYRIASVWEHPYQVLQYVRRNGEAFVIFAFAHGMRHWDKNTPRFRLRGLDPAGVYRCEDGREMTGEALMQCGVRIHLRGDYDAKMQVWHKAD